MKIVILGAGALGCYYGARLEQSGHNVSFIMRSDYPYVKEHGLHVKSVNGDIDIPHPSVFKTPNEAGHADIVVVAWKTTSNNQLAKALPSLVGKNTIILTLQNGMGNAEAIAATKLVPENRIYVGLCFICAMRRSAGKIDHLEGGNIQFASYIPSLHGSKKAEELAELFKNAHIPTQSFDELEKIQWFKLVWNIPFNGLCLAKGGVSIAELYHDQANVNRARKIMQEVVAAAKARGYDLPGGIVDYQMERTEKMGEFVPSSAIDYRMQRPVEYDAIWGIPIEKARIARAEIPEWEKLDREIRERIGLS